MKFITSIRIKLGRYFLRKHTSKLQRNRQAIKLKDARDIGLVFHMSSEEEYATIGRFVGELQAAGKKVWVLGYSRTAKAPVYYAPKLSYDLILKGNLDFFMRPTTEFAAKFIDHSFDILFDLGSSDEFSLAWVVELSKARFKVGKGISGKQGPFDLQIEPTQEMTIKALIDEMVHYTSSIDFVNPYDQKIETAL